MKRNQVDSLIRIFVYLWLFTGICCFKAHGQVAVTPYVTSQEQFLDQNGNPLVAGCVFTYAAGTTTPLATYTDSTGSVQNANPIILNAGGFPPSGIWVTASAYKFVVKSFGGTACASGSIIRTEDNSTQGSIINAVTLAGVQTITGNKTFSGNNTFSGSNTFTGATTLQNENDVLWVGLNGYATCAAALTAAGPTNKTIIVLRSSYAGADCPADTAYNFPNVTVLDYSGAKNPNNAPFNGCTYNESDGNVLAGIRCNYAHQTYGGTNAATVGIYGINFQTNSSPPAGATQDGIAGECNTAGTLTGTLGHCTAAEHQTSIASTTGIVTDTQGVLGAVNITGTTAVGTARSFWAKKGTFSGTAPTHAVGLDVDDMSGVGSADSYAARLPGRTLLRWSSVINAAALMVEDSTSTARSFIAQDNTGLMNIQSPTATGEALEDSGGNIKLLISSAGAQFRGPINMGSSGTVLISPTAPTISSGFGTTPSIASSNGSSTFRINVGAGGAATSGVIGLPAATTGWNCQFADISTLSNFPRQTASSTTTATVGGFNSAGAATAWGVNDVLIAHCDAF